MCSTDTSQAGSSSRASMMNATDEGGRSRIMPEISMALDRKTAKIVWRDFLFLILGGVALSITGYVEQHAADEDRGGITSEGGLGIVDAGFNLTKPLHAYLEQHQSLCDLLAALNSVALLIPLAYVTYVTIWKGDYSLAFRLIATQLLRSFCGWFTYLPPSPSFLTSYYDFPDIVHCLFQDCSGAPKVLPFVSFFSGHVATMVVAANHMWLNGFTTLAVIVHALDAFQILRLLATRGHYSIDIIIGWYMAVSVSDSAARLGRYYSRGTCISDMMPTNAAEAFETITGVGDERNQQRMSTLLNRDDVQEMLLQSGEKQSVQTETTATFLCDKMDSYIREAREAKSKNI